MKSDCCGAEVKYEYGVESCLQCHGVLRVTNPMGHVVSGKECQPDEPRESKDWREYCGSCGSHECQHRGEYGHCLAEKDEHPGRWPVSGGHQALDGAIDDRTRAFRLASMIEDARDYILLLEARAERAEKERDIAQEIAAQWGADRDRWVGLEITKLKDKVEALGMTCSLFQADQVQLITKLRAVEKERDELRDERDGLLLALADWRKENAALREDKDRAIAGLIEQRQIAQELRERVKELEQCKHPVGDLITARFESEKRINIYRCQFCGESFEKEGE